jgi:hypothetical protein
MKHERLVKILAYSSSLTCLIIVIDTLIKVAYFGKCTIIAPYGEAPFEIFFLTIGLGCLLILIKEEKRRGDLRER